MALPSAVAVIATTTGDGIEFIGVEACDFMDFGVGGFGDTLL